MNLPLKTERLSIRALDENDWALFSHLYTDSEVMKHISAPLDTIALKEKFIERLNPWDRETNGWLSLVIEIDDGTETQSIGLIGLKTVSLDTRIVEVGFILDIPHSGKGYAIEALGCIVKYAFNHYEYNKICATCSVDNIDSQVTLERNGFIKEGVLRHNSLIGEQFVDDMVYGLLVHEVEA